jgi:hypothetical protein
MAKVIGKEELCSTDLKYFKAVRIIDERTLFDRYDSLANVVKNNIDAQYQDFITYPVKEGDKITFHGKISKETPQVLNNLQGDEAVKYQNIKSDTLHHYNSKIEALKNSGKTDEAEFLASAVNHVDDRFVYCYDDKVVLGVWGMKLRDKVREDIREICKNMAVKKKPVISENPPIPPVKPDQEPVPAVEEHIAEEPPVVRPVIEKKRHCYKRFGTWRYVPFAGRGCLKWLAWLLLLLLLLLLFWWLFRSCSGGHHPVLTPSGYENVLPPAHGILPPVDSEPAPVDSEPDIIPDIMPIDNRRSQLEQEREQLQGELERVKEELDRVNEELNRIEKNRQNIEN